MSATPRILGLGDNTVDTYVDAGLQFPGGNAVNVAVLARCLWSLGIPLRRVVVVSDEVEAIAREVRELSHLHDWLFTSGGVGPTHDDVTVEAVATAFGVRVVSSPHMEAMLRAHYQERCTPGHLRMALVPATNFVSRVLPAVMLAGFFFARGLSGMLLDIAILCYAVLTVFQLITLPVEFDASRRAKVQLVELGILDRDEMPGVNQTLDAAALTYVAAFVSSLLYLLYLLSARGRN